MRMKYNILWFENEKTFVDSLRRKLKDYLEEEGFEMNLELKAKRARLKTILDEDWNLILMDLKLGSTVNGDTIIRRIRGNKIFTEIIFYSEYVDGLEKVSSSKKMQMLDGIFYNAGRGNLFDKIKRVIKLTLRKSQDVNNIRGLVIAEAIELDSKMDDMILKYFIKGIDKKNFFRGKILAEEFFTSGAKFKTIQRIIKDKIKLYIEEIEKESDSINKKELKKKMNNLEMLKSECNKIQEEVIETRNILSHVKESKDKKNTLISTFGRGRTIIITDEWCRDCRKKLKKHSENLDAIIKHI